MAEKAKHDASNEAGNGQPSDVQHVKVVSMSGAIEDAEALIKDRLTLTERIGANRELCRMLVRAGYANAEQKATVEKLYPSKGPSKGSKAEPVAA